MATFSLATGLRAANVTGLEWSQVDEGRRLCWVHPDQAKARKAIAVPLNGEALAIVQKQKQIHATQVFSFRGKPITQVSTKAWYGALKRAGIENFRWHDLRHTWASWHMQNGTPLFVLQELEGWESSEMVRRYAHPAADHLAPFAERLSALNVPEPKFTARLRHSPKIEHLEGPVTRRAARAGQSIAKSWRVQDFYPEARQEALGTYTR